MKTEKMFSDTISICFCAWNEQDNIKKCIDDAVFYAENSFPDSYEIFVIDNASTDNTPNIVNSLSQVNPKIKLHRHSENRMYSGSYKSAMEISSGKYIAVIDGDFQHTCRDINAALKLIKNSGIDIVYGWKVNRKDGLLRNIFSFGLKVVSQVLIGHRLNDINCGFRVFSDRAAKSIKINEKINSVGPEIYCSARENGLFVGEIPVEHFPRVGNGGIHSSIVPLLKGTKKFILYLLRLNKKFGSTPVMQVRRS